MPRRIAVVGVSGNGKTTFARRLAAKLDLPCTELDALNHKPGWIEASADELRRDVEAVMNRSDGWVLDGSYHGKLVELKSVRKVRRREVHWPITGRGDRQEERRAGAHAEDFRAVDLRLARRFGRQNLCRPRRKRMHFRRRPEWPARLENYPDIELVRLRSPREVEAWFESVTAESAE